MDASDTIIYVSEKAQTVPGHGKATPVGVPCVRPQSDMRCYRLDRCDSESGSRQTSGPFGLGLDGGFRVSEFGSWREFSHAL